jgi:hypothetical protein
MRYEANHERDERLEIDNQTHQSRKKTLQREREIHQNTHMSTITEKKLRVDVHTHILPPSWPDFKKKFGYGT